MTSIQKKGFNLLRPQIEPEGKWDKIYAWVNGTARIVVIFVELIVIVCFGVRVVVDRQARDLEKVLDKNKAQLDKVKDAEARIRQLQSDLQMYEGIWAQSSDYAPVVEEVYNYNPALFSAMSVSIDASEIKINGSASRDDIDSLEKVIKNSNMFYDQQLLNYKPEGGESALDLGSFNISAQLLDATRIPIAEKYEQVEATQ